jgi:hypothetical protein
MHNNFVGYLLQSGHLDGQTVDGRIILKQIVRI